ncbi:Uncharacterised protein [BD1-7 clade bacterium]|uniref:Shikimate kinase n=1 Tax=BD1-7 clade bacterium TaxID=2029982 RepID=A0A5S9QZ04_9GAMM|nr:Uncharacterised protein [BD1-7 clade bacterium]
MKRVVIFGNSGSGKSTLAKALCDKHGLAHFDLDTIAWEASQPPIRKPTDESTKTIESFVVEHRNWVIEGCYADLLDMVMPHASEIIFLDLPVEVCIANAKNRPWEPHKYASKEAQDANLDMLIDWISQYNTRGDEFSHTAHTRLFESYNGEKTRYMDNHESI